MEWPLSLWGFKEEEEWFSTSSAFGAAGDQFGPCTIPLEVCEFDEEATKQDAPDDPCQALVAYQSWWPCR